MASQGRGVPAVAAEGLCEQRPSRCNGPELICSCLGLSGQLGFCALFTWVSQFCETDLLSNKNANVSQVYEEENQSVQQ